jgi:uncharacterized protein (TIGR03435 family)
MKITIGFLAAIALFAQQPGGNLDFEVVSVKPMDPALSQGGVARMTRSLKGGYEARNLALRDLILTAYRLRPYQLAGGPNWLGSAGWDVDAKYPVGASGSDLPRMMQAMLADRFQLVAHFETRTASLYNLVVAKNGPRLHEAGATDGSSMSAGPRMIKYGAASMAELANQLSSYLECEVTDRTGLSGRYAINLSFAPVELSTSTETASDSRPTIFQAVEEQLGLKLESAKGPVQVLVIDRAEKPSAN